MKCRFGITVLVLMVGALAAAPTRGQGTGQDQEALKAKYEAKLKKDFLKNATWIIDYDKARAEAKAKGKLIFAYFTRTYAR